MANPQDMLRVKSNVKRMVDAGAPESDIDSYLASEATNAKELQASAADPSAPLKPNQALGFLNGGAQAFNNALNWGSGALQRMGVPAAAVHAAGSVIRDPLDVGNDVVRATGINPNQRNVLAPLPNQDQINQLNAAAAAQGQRPGTAGKIAGQVVSAIPLAVAAAPLTAAAGGLGAAGRIGAAALEGGASGALNAPDPNDPAGVGLNALVGAGTAGTLNAGGGVLASTLAPRLSPQLMTLINGGMRNFSLGRLAGSKTAAQMEDMLTSNPLIGPMVKGQQAASMQDLNRAVLQRSATSAGLTDDTGAPYQVPAQVTHQTYSDMADRLGNQLDQQQGAVNVQADPQLTQQVQAATARLRQLGNTQLADQIDQTLNPVTQPQYDPNTLQWGYGQIAGRDAANLRSSLRDAAKDIANPKDGGSAPFNAYDQQQAIGAVNNALDGSIQRQFPDVAAQMGRTQQGYAQFSQAQQAAMNRAPIPFADPSEFNPKDFYNATMNSGRATGSTVRQGAQGNIPGQDFAEAAQILNPTVSDSGTAPRALLNTMLTGGAGLGGGATTAGMATGNSAMSLAGMAGMAPTAGLGLAYAANPVISRVLAAQALATQAPNSLLAGARRALDPSEIQSYLASLAGNGAADAVNQGQPQ